MIGHTDRNHHVGKAEKQQRKQRTVKWFQFDDLTKNAIKKEETVETTEYQQGSYDELCTVQSCELHQTLVDLIRNKHEKRQQRVAIDIVDSAPLGYNFIA